jgi:hypothetical protein
VQALTSTLKTSTSNIIVGDTFTLTWSSPGAIGCTPSDGGANGSTWSGTLAPSGATTQTATETGTFTYILTCDAPYDGATATPQQVVINVSAASSSGNGSSSGGQSGGGGSIRPIELLLLVGLRALRRRRV